MFKRIRTGLLCMGLAAASTVAIAQSFTTFVNARVVTQLDLQGQLTANGSTGTTGQALTSNGAGDVTWSTVAGGVTGLANPSGTIGLTATNGVATTALRSDGTHALSQSIAPTWTATHIFANNGANASFVGNDPRYLISESDGNVDEKNWLVRAVANQFNIATATDASPFSAVNSAFTIARSGTGVGQISLSSGTSTIILTGSSTSLTVGASGLTAISGSTSTGQFLNTDSNPSYYVNETDAAADEKLYRLNSVAGDLVWSTRTDANGSGVTFLTVDRGTGTALNGLTWTAPSITAAGILFTNGSRFEIENAAPLFQGDETDAPANERSWLQRQTAGDWFLSTATDASPQAPVSNAIVATRTGTTVDSVAFSSTALTWNANTLFTTANDGSGSLLDADFLDGLSSAAFAQLAANNTFTGNMLISKDDPQFNTVDTNAAADEQRWSVLNQAGQWSLRTRTDADGAGANAILCDRTGTTVDSCNITASTVSLNGIASTDFARLSQSNTFLGSTQQVSNTGGARVVLRDSDAGADTQCFFSLSQSGQYDLYASADATCTSTSGAESALQILRSGVNITDVRFPNGTVRLTSTDSPAIATSLTNVTSEVSTTDVVANMQLTGNDAPTSAFSMTRATASNASPTLFSNKARGSVGAFAIVTADDSLFRLLGSGFDGTTWSNAAEILFASDGTPGSGDMPGRMIFSTTADGSNSPTERMRISSTGLVTIAGKTTATNGVTATGGVNSGNRFSASTQSPTSLSANTNDWALTPVPVVLVAASAAVNITGIDASTANADSFTLGNNVFLDLINKSSSKLTLTHEDAASTAANRFALPYSSPFVIGPNESVALYYDTVASRWYVRSGKQVSAQTNFSGNLTFNTGCTANYDVPYLASKIGNQVTFRIANTGGSCTGNATSFQSAAAALPTEIRPNVTTCIRVGAVNNGNAILMNFCLFQTGAVSGAVCQNPGAASGSSCSPTGWTASGTRQIHGDNATFTYNIEISGVPAGGGS